MFRALVRNVKNVSNFGKFLLPSTSRVTICKRFEFTDILENAKKIEDSKFEELKKYRQIEVHLWHSLTSNSYLNPAEYTEEQWQHLYELDTKHQSKRFCQHLFWKKKAKLEKKERDAEEREAKKGNQQRVRAERDANPHIFYGLGHNSLHLRISSQTMNKWLNAKLHRAKLYGQKIIIDCSYESYMTDLERSRVASGLKFVYTYNRKHRKPLDLHICGVKPNSAIIANLNGQIPTLLKKNSPTKLHSECFTELSELFPKERLVMLSPDANEVFKYDANDIYVVGGIVDFGRSDPLTLAKSKELGIRSARMPLDNIRLEEGDTRELTTGTTIGIVRECQINDDIDDVIKKCIKLKSDIRRERKNQKNFG